MQAWELNKLDLGYKINISCEKDATELRLEWNYPCWHHFTILKFSGM
jgi:hypothetical protein